MPRSPLPTPDQVLCLAEALVKVGFPADLKGALATLHEVTAGDSAVLEDALALARAQSRTRRSMVLVVELLMRSLVSPTTVNSDARLVTVGAD
ncbi:MAG: hypothetical protein JWL70_2790 [Acidimicrobiia bacterium]|nr:hypothetical protein [Acidimicrobiia bacterium]